MKRTKTSDPDLVVYPNGMIYFVRGRREISMRTKIFKEAVMKKRILEGRFESLVKIPLKLKFSDIVGDYLLSRENDLKTGRIRASTLNETQTILAGHLIPFFGPKKIALIDSFTWEDYKAKKSIDLTNHRKIMSHFMKWAKMHNYAANIPIFALNKIKRRKRRILKPQEMKLIWQHSGGSLKLFISMALFMGMRRSEIMTLEWSQVNLQERFLFLPEAKTKTKTDRYVPLAQDAYDQLMERLKQSQSKRLKSSFVFPNAKDPKRHGDLSGLKTAWATVKRRAFNTKVGEATEDITWHDLRATCEAWAHKRTDLTPTQLEKFFGSNIDIQRKIYVTFNAEDVRGVENSIGGFLDTVGRSAGESGK